MSARPALSLLPPEELDLLISRSLDGDLSADEQEELERYLASDADARRRRDEMAALVRSVHDLAAPEPPFALATRVNAQVAERAQGLQSAWNRFGIYPPPGTVPAVIVLLVAAVVVATFASVRPRPVPARDAAPDRNEPVRVFFQDAAALRFSVEVVGGNTAWTLATTPETRPAAAIDATYRLSLDAAGRVASLRPLTAGTDVRPDVAELLRGLVFTRSGAASASREVDVRIAAR